MRHLPVCIYETLLAPVSVRSLISYQTLIGICTLMKQRVAILKRLTRLLKCAHFPPYALSCLRNTSCVPSARVHLWKTTVVSFGAQFNQLSNSLSNTYTYETTSARSALYVHVHL